MNTGRALPILLLLLLAGSVFADSTSLPDYQRAEKKEFKWACDADETRIETDLYRADTYYVAVSGTEKSPTFMSVYYVAEGRAQFLVKPKGSPDPVELPREAWQEKIKSDMSLNYFKRIRNMENDCICLIGCD